MIIDFRKRGREGEKHRCKRETLVASSSRPNQGDQTHNPGMCPDQELNLWPFSLWNNTPNNSHSSRLAFKNSLLEGSLSILLCKSSLLTQNTAWAAVLSGVVLRLSLPFRWQRMNTEELQWLPEGDEKTKTKTTKICVQSLALSADIMPVKAHLST